MKFLAAVVLLLRIVSLQDFSTLLVKGQSFLEQNRLSEAEDVFARAVELQPDDPSAHYYLGLALLSQGKNEEAARSLERAYSLSARPQPSVLYELGTAYLRTERLDEAERTLSQAAKLAPEQARMHLQLGWVYYLKVEGEKAEAEFNKAVELAPSGVAYYYKALGEVALGRLEHAVASLRWAVELQPDLADAHLVLGKTLAQLGKYQEAEPPLRAALGLDPQAAEASHQLGLLASRRGELQDAGRLFLAAVAADPQHQAAWYNLALVYERLGQKDKASEARAQFEALAKKAPRRTKSLSRANPRQSARPH